MATDINSGLPIRTENPGDVEVKVVDSSDPNKQLKINEDGSLNANTRALTSEADSVSAHIKDAAGNPFSAANPLPVSIEESKGDEVDAFLFTNDVAPDASANLDYVVTALKTFVGESLFASGSGRIRVEVQKETATPGSFESKFVGFNSTANPNVEIPLKKIFKQVAGRKVRIVIKNLDKQIQNVYATLLGVER